MVHTLRGSILRRLKEFKAYIKEDIPFSEPWYIPFFAALDFFADYFNVGLGCCTFGQAEAKSNGL